MGKVDLFSSKIPFSNFCFLGVEVLTTWTPLFRGIYVKYLSILDTHRIDVLVSNLLRLIIVLSHLEHWSLACGQHHLRA
jgi:hypothetical protein